MLRKAQKIIAIVLVTIFCLVLTVSTQAAGAAGENYNTIASVDGKFQESQISSKFPEDNQTSRIFAQSRRAFKAYRGQGKMIVENHGATKAEVYVNGKLIAINKALETPDGKMTIDIGEYTVDGDNALKVLNIEPKKTYIDVKIFYPELRFGSPSEVGFLAQKLAKVDELINSEVAKGFPGAVLVVLKDGKIIKNTAYGWQKKYDGEKLLDKWQPMKADTMFDLASNTKMWATVFAMMKLTSEGKLNPEDYVSKYLPEFVGDGREGVKVRDVLSHSAGFSSEIKFHEPEKAGKFYSLEREKTMGLVEKAPLAYPTGSKTIYSDTDYIILADIIEKITGQQLDEYVEQNIYQPLGLTHTLFNPLQKGFAKERFAATERMGNTRDNMKNFPNVRRYTLQGEVHDEKAFYSLGGVSGHAGLFSRGQDLAVLAQVILNGGGYGGYKLCSQNVVTYFTKPTDRNNAFGLGWNKGGNTDNIYEFGPYATDLVIGHTGWVGIDSCIDLKHDMAIILLTNKVHAPNVPGEPNKFTTGDFETGKYGSIISLVYEALLEKY